MDKPNKERIRKAIFVTSRDYPSRYFLHVSHDGIIGGWIFHELHGVEVLTLAAGNALVRTMRAHVYDHWAKEYAFSRGYRR